MRNLLCVLCSLLFTASSLAAPTDPSLKSAATRLRSSDSALVQQAIHQLRDAGPAGLTAALADYDQKPDANLAAGIDAIAGQRGAITSRLYWYTDFDQAKAAAKQQHKPILYLRLLGKLTDEYSCANSRFFRTVLYSNAQVSAFLREKFVLVWVSERPVPVVTIDYGDGHVMKRTITGNSIHYVLDCDGNVVDALPGLYGPSTFIGIASDAGTIAISPRAARTSYLRHYTEAEAQLIANWQLETANATVMENTLATPQAKGVANPWAIQAMPRAVGKSVVERPLLVRLSPELVAQMDKGVKSADEAAWQHIARNHASECLLDDGSINVIRGQNPKLKDDPDALNKTVARFQQLIALDTVHNQYQFRRQILDWLKNDTGHMTVEALNRKVYADLFLTPRSDPWLGMATGEYCALDGNGCVDAAK